MRNRIPFGLTDIVIGGCLFLFLGGVSLCGISGARDTANRAKCQDNLHQIGQAILLYQNDNQQLFPRTVQDTTGKPKPVWGTPYESDKKLTADPKAACFNGGKFAPAANDVTASLYLLLSKEKVDAAVFVCPASELKPWDFGGKDHVAAQWTNWPGNDGLAKHLSYSLQNPFATNEAIMNGFNMGRLDATFAIAADMNPGGEAVTKVTVKSTGKDLEAANSLNHAGQGQNVLYGDGHAEFQSTPFCGTQHDNIYTAFGPEIKDAGRKKAVIVSSSCDSTDSILLPTAADIGFKPSGTN